MRTRIALVVVVPITVITVSILTQTATAPSVQAETHATARTTSSAAVVMAPDRLVVYRARTRSDRAVPPSSPLDGLVSGLLTDPPTTESARPASPTSTSPSTPHSPPPTPIPAEVAVVPGTTVGHQPPGDTVTPYLRAAWARVAECEEGGDWSFDGPVFSGGLGISRANWIAFGGEQFAPEAAIATEDEQIMVAERIQADPPDQDGCSGW